MQPRTVCIRLVIERTARRPKILDGVDDQRGFVAKETRDLACVRVRACLREGILRYRRDGARFHELSCRVCSEARIRRAPRIEITAAGHQRSRK